MITKEEFEKTYIRMMDSLRDNNFKGRKTCENVSCEDCPLKDFCYNPTSAKTYRPFDLIEMVEKWGKEHPLVTRADKFKEVFGVEPRYSRDSELLLCPGEARNEDYCHTHSCTVCKQNYWYEEEYIEPKKGV